MKKSLGSKRKEISDEHREELIQSYLNFQESEICKIYDNKFFGYTKVTIEQPQKDEDGKTITKNGRGDVSSNPKGALKSWQKKS